MSWWTKEYKPQVKQETAMADQAREKHHETSENDWTNNWFYDGIAVRGL